MKKLSTLLIMAFALVLGLTQCKKKNVDTIATPNNLGEAVYITVNVGGDKHTVNPGTGEVNFENGDKIYVGNGGHYIGTLTYDGSAFGGPIYDPKTTDYLHFYFVGGLTPSATPVPGTTPDFTVSIADQSTRLPVLSYGRSTEKYTTSSATYSCTLANKCGLVKFVPATATSETVKVHGMKTTATINFATPGITPTNATGTITLYPENEEAKWAILLPQDEVSTPDGMIGKDGCIMSKVPEVTANLYSISGVSMTVKPGMLSRQFTINSEGDKVRFSQGNLRATTSDEGSSWTWSFATNQYDYIGAAAANTSISGNGTVSADGTVDLFGWSTATTYYGINDSNNNDDYSGDFKDWGGTIGNTWRTLTSAEWAYLFNTRSNTTVNNVENARFTKTAITTPSSTTVNGLIIFPDSYSGGTPSGVTWGTINGTSSGYTTTCTADGWAALEAAGCVFLPAAGRRLGAAVNNVGSNGYYWSSTANSASDAYDVYFRSSLFNLSDVSNRYFGYSVRLVIAFE